MCIRLSAHGAYHHQYHIVRIPKYRIRRKVLKGDLKTYVEEHLDDVRQYHPEVEIHEHSVQANHIHLVVVISPKYSASSIVGKIKANTSRDIRDRFEYVRRICRRNVF